MQIYAERSNITNVLSPIYYIALGKNKAKTIEEKAQIGYPKPSLNASSNNRFGLNHNLESGRDKLIRVDSKQILGIFST